MKTVKMWKTYNPDRLFGGYFWNKEYVYDDWKGVNSDPYLVEVPDEFYVGKSTVDADEIFSTKSQIAYDVCGTSTLKNCRPLLIGGSPVEEVELKIVRKLDDNEHEQYEELK